MLNNNYQLFTQEVQKQELYLVLDNVELSKIQDYFSGRLAQDPEDYLQTYYDLIQKGTLTFNGFDKLSLYKMHLMNLLMLATNEISHEMIIIRDIEQRKEAFRDNLKRIKSIKKSLNKYEQELKAFINGVEYEWKGLNQPIFFSWTYLQHMALKKFEVTLENLEDFIVSDSSAVLLNNWYSNPGLRWNMDIREHRDWANNLEWVYNKLSKKYIGTHYKTFKTIMLGDNKTTYRILWKGTEAELSYLIRWMKGKKMIKTNSGNVWYMASQTFISLSGFLFDPIDLEKNYHYKSEHGGKNCNSKDNLCCIVDMFETLAR